jgi:uncharacterized damage-inducible protein DinB
MLDFVKTILRGQFEASLSMLDRCIRTCPPEHWDGVVGARTFRQVAYHTLYYTDLYLSPGKDALERRDLHRRGSELNQEEIRAYLKVCRRKAVAMLAAENAASLQADSEFSRLSLSRGELHLYNIRHVQHHSGQLSAYLRRFVRDGKLPWIKSGWR